MKTKNVSCEDIMFAILDQKDSTFTININGQLYKHLTPTQTVDLIEQGVQQFTELNGHIIDETIDYIESGTMFIIVFKTETAKLKIRGRNDYQEMPLEDFIKAHEKGYYI